MSTRPLLTVAQVAERLAVRDVVVRQLIRTGELPAVDVGLGATHLYRVRPEAVERWLDYRATRSPLDGLRAKR